MEIDTKDSSSTSYKPVERLFEYLEEVPDDSPIFGPLTHGLLRMPKVSNDGRVLTWTKTINKVASKIVNNPQSDLWCWLVHANTNNGSNILKLSPTGSANKWKTGKALHILTCCSAPFMQFDQQCLKVTQESNEYELKSGMIPCAEDPESAYIVGNDKSSGYVAAHLCRNGDKNTLGKLVCINPFHITLVPQYVNVSHHGCEFGNRATCPHGNCIWTWKDTGEPKYCLHQDIYLRR